MSLFSVVVVRTVTIIAKYCAFDLKETQQSQQNAAHLQVFFLTFCYSVNVESWRRSTAQTEHCYQINIFEFHIVLIFGFFKKFMVISLRNNSAAESKSTTRHFRQQNKSNLFLKFCSTTQANFKHTKKPRTQKGHCFTSSFTDKVEFNMNPEQ